MEKDVNLEKKPNKQGGNMKKLRFNSMEKKISILLIILTAIMLIGIFSFPIFKIEKYSHMHVGGYGDSYKSSSASGTLINTGLLSGLIMLIGFIMVLIGTIMNYILIKFDKDTDTARSPVLIGQIILAIMIFVILFISGESDTNGVAGAWKSEGYKVHKRFSFFLFEIGTAAVIFLGFKIFPLDNRDIVKEKILNNSTLEYEFFISNKGYKYSPNEVKVIANNLDLSYVCNYENNNLLSIQIYIKPYRGIKKIKEFNLQVLSTSNSVLFEVRKDDLELSLEGTTFEFRFVVASIKSKITLLNYGYDEFNCRFDIGKKQIKIY